MTATYAVDEQPHGHPLLPGASPADIRAHLLPEDRAQFDTAYAQALADAKQSLDLTGLFETLEQWHGWSRAAQRAFDELKTTLELNPQGGRPAQAAYPDRPSRMMAFGPHKEGLAGYVVIDREDRRVVVVVEVMWLGD